MTKFRFSNINHIHAHSPALMIEAAHISETLVPIYQVKLPHISRNLHAHSHENLKSHIQYMNC
jgi:hypothetical protein